MLIRCAVSSAFLTVDFSESSSWRWRFSSRCRAPSSDTGGSLEACARRQLGGPAGHERATSQRARAHTPSATPGAYGLLGLGAGTAARRTAATLSARIGCGRARSSRADPGPTVERPPRREDVV